LRRQWLQHAGRGRDTTYFGLASTYDLVEHAADRDERSLRPAMLESDHATGARIDQASTRTGIGTNSENPAMFTTVGVPLGTPQH
jgi:hypothetical protein